MQQAFLLNESLAEYDLIVTAEYFIGFAIGLRLQLSGVRTPYVLWGMNQSRRLLTQPGAAQLARWAFNRCDAIITHSRKEIEQFSRIHQIRPERFHFEPWGYDLPAAHNTPFPAQRRPYVCLIGRNNRDLDGYAQAVQQAGVHGVLICGDLPPEHKIGSKPADCKCSKNCRSHSVSAASETPPPTSSCSKTTAGGRDTSR